MPLTQVQGGMLAGSTNTTTTIQSNGTTAITIDSSQNVGIGTTSPNARLSTSGSAGTGNGISIIDTTYSNDTHRIYGDNSMQLSAGSGGAGAILFRTNNGTERMRLNGSGQLLVATANGSMGGTGKTPVQRILSSTSALIGLETTATTTYNMILFNNGNGEVGAINTSGTGTSYGTTSDYRLKENIAPMTGALDKVAQLKPCTYTWKTDGSLGQGFIAHELQAVVPDCVTGEKDAVNENGSPQYQNVDTSYLVATLTAAIQELNAKVEAQAAEIAALKAAP